MKISGMNGMEAVLAVARHRNFRAAATELDVSTSALSYAVQALEARIGVRLFNRTTRSVSLSEAGAQFVKSVGPAIATIRDAMDQAGSLRDTPSGTLRINTSLGAAKQVMSLFTSFLHRYPAMKLDIVTEGRQIDIVGEGFDAGIRLTSSVPLDMISVPFRRAQRFAVVGCPSYFASHTKPTTPSDLIAHTCIRSRTPSGVLEPWEFSRRGKTVRVDVKGVITLDEPTLMLAAVREGLGVAYLTKYNVSADLKAGKLEQVLADWTPSFGDLSFYYPGRRHASAGLRALVKLIREQSSK
jgi:DNA-binding transcriptional LysR family regulator